MTVSSHDILVELEKKFGFASLRPGQLEVIQDVLNKRSVISVMPTGAGKSLCYQLPACILAKDGGVTLVVSPLIALMKDQVDSLLQRGIRCAALTSAASMSEQNGILDGIKNGAYDIIYVAPERFHSSRFMSALRQLRSRLALLAIDEAHCISEWGHDFRPAYRLLGQAINNLAPPRVLAVTATATPEVQRDISEQLGIAEPSLHVRGFARPNLCFTVEHRGGGNDKSKHIVTKIQALPNGAAVVYAATRKNAERYASDLAAAGVRVRAYHAGLEDRHRIAIQDEFMNGDIDAIVATNAFGMGVDKTNVRLVIHADLTRSIEAYYQEAGRGGRDGHNADCVLLFNHGDVRLQEFLIDASFPTAVLLRALWKLLRETPGLSIRDIATYQLPGEPHESTQATAVRILIHHGYVRDDGGLLSAVHPGEISGDYPAFDPESSERRAEVERNKLQTMVNYAYHTGCRHTFVLDYFGDDERSEDRCVACDNCQGRGEAKALSEQQLDHAEKLLRLIAELDGRFGRKRIGAIANGSDDDERFYGLPHRGTLTGCSQKGVLDLLRCLEAGSLIEQARGEYPTIKLTQHGKKIAKGTRDIDPDLLRILSSSSSKTRSAQTASNRKAAHPALAGTPPDPKALDSLRTLRTELAKAQEVPSYVIFSNRTLDELAALKPKNQMELGQIHGIGPSRIEKYGDEIIAALARLS